MELEKRVSESSIVSTRWMFPADANPAGNVFGGAIVRYVDEVAGVVAQRHSRCNVVLASIDRMDFHIPVKIGDTLTFRASVNCVGETSMEIGVRIESESLKTGEVRHAATAYATMVALDDRGVPTKVPRLIPETDDEKRRYSEATARRLARKASKGK